jgi:hypothetical protein
MASKKNDKVTKADRKDGRLNLLIDPELKNWAKEYAYNNDTTVTTIITEHLKALREKENDLCVQQI